MSWLQAQMASLDAASALVQFAANWFLQSALLIAVGLATGRLLAGRGSAVQSAVYRTTLAAVLICPLASALLSLAGVSGWSLAMPSPWTYAEVEPIVTDAAPAAEPALADPSLAIEAASPADLAALDDQREQGLADGESSSLGDLLPDAASPDGMSPDIVSSDAASPEDDSPIAASAVNPSTTTAQPAVDSRGTGAASLAAAAHPIQLPGAPPTQQPTLAVHLFGWVALVISAMWLLVSAALLSRLAMAWWRMTRLLRGAMPADAATSQICGELASRLVVAAPDVFRSPYLPSPCLAGLRKPVVLLPEVELGLSIRDVLVHELAHLVRRDCHWNLVRLSSLAAFFFQPLLWTLSRRLEMTAEEVCDDYVVQYGGDRLEYAYRLVDIAELCTAPTAAAGVGIVSLRSMLAKRVQRIMDPARSLSTRVGSLLLALVIVGGLLGTVIVGLVGIDPRPSVAEVAVAQDKASPQRPERAETLPDSKQPPIAADALPADALPAAEALAAETLAALPTTSTEPATRPGTTETPAAATSDEATPTLSFRRDSVQLAAGAFDVASLSFSAGDQFLAASGGGAWNNPNPGQARIWDFAQAKEVAAFPTPRGIISMALSSDGRRVALGSWSGEVWLREIGGAQLLHTKFKAPLRVAFSPDGKLLIGVTERGELRTWDALTGILLDKSTGAFQGGTFPFCWVGFSPDGKFLVACGGKASEASGVKFAVWSVETREQLYQKKVDLVQAKSPFKRLVIFSAAISPDSQTLATNGDHSISLWDLATGAPRGRTPDAGGLVYRVEFSPGGNLLASTNFDSSGVVTLWDPSTSAAVGTLTGHQNHVRALAFTHDGRSLVTGGADRTIRVWDVATRRQTSTLQRPEAQLEPNGDVVASMAIAYSPDGKCVATARADGQVSVYGLAPPGLLRSWPAHADVAAALAWSPDGRTLASGGYDKSIRLWNPATGDLIRSLDGHTGWILSLAFSHDGQTLASGSHDHSIRLWNVEDGAQRRVLAGHLATVRSLDFSHSDQLLASASADRTVRLWDVASGQQQAALAGHESGVRAVAFSSDDRLLASGGEDQAVKVWNVDAHDLRGTLAGHGDVVSAVAFAQDTLVSAGLDRTIRTWDADAAKSRGKLAAGPSAIVALAVAPDGHRLLTAGDDQSLSLWKSVSIEGQPAESPFRFRALPVLREDFAGKYSLNWDILREDKSHLSLSENPGRLTITTQPGSIHGDAEHDGGIRPNNIFLIRNPLGAMSDFSITLAVSKIDPAALSQQVGLLCYDDEDNYLKWSFEHNGTKPNTTNFVMVRETGAVPKHDPPLEVPTAERLWLRLTKRGGAYESAYSTDGKNFTVAESHPWGDHPPKYLGFMADNGTNTAANEMEVCIDSFELSAPRSADDHKPITHNNPRHRWPPHHRPRSIGATKP